MRWVVDNGGHHGVAEGLELVDGVDLGVAFDPDRWAEARAVAFTDADPVHTARSGGQHG